MDYLLQLPDSAVKDAISHQHGLKQRWVNQEKKGFLRYRKPFLELAKYQASAIDLAQDAVKIGDKDEVSCQQRQEIRELLRAFMPWRKGPFQVFGIDIDAEWRSELKWNRIAGAMPDLQGKIVADIGCNNGYYMFRMAHLRPRLVLGFEPGVQHYYCFKALNAMAGCSNLEIDLLGVEHIDLFAKCFDVIFLMGIIYHRPSPIDTLRSIASALAPGGVLILETQAIPGSDEMALFPESTYAKAPGIYFVPTASCLQNWLSKAGFTKIEILASTPMTCQEQRPTEWMVFESYQDFIDPQQPEKTVEGYPAPLRLAVKAYKK